MFSFIIIGKDPDKRHSYIQSFCTEKGIGKFDITTIDPLENSFGIAEIRNIQKTTYLRPMQGKEKAVILNNAQTITLEAQNALLKLLEEPPNNTYIFLSATTDGPFLPTILSRCKKVVLEQEKGNLASDKKEALQLSLQAMQGTIGERLSLAEKLAAKKEELPLWFEQIILLLRDAMLSQPEEISYPQLLRGLQHAHTLFQTTNVAPRMILEHTFLSLW